MNIIWSIFPKFYAHLGPSELAALVREVGLDTTNIVIREGYWVTPDNMAQETPAFLKAMEKEGLEVHFATAASFTSAALQKDDTPLAILADNGISEFRMGYFRVENDDVRGSIEAARRDMEALAPICEKRGVRAVYQLHPGTLITNSIPAWMIVRDLPSRWVGVMPDPGNQTGEGWENWRQAALLLKDHWVALGVKDAAWRRDESKTGDPNKGWGRRSAPLHEGIIDWHKVVDALTLIDFKGTFVFMPFYDHDNPRLMTEKLKKEVAYLRGVVGNG